MAYNVHVHYRERVCLLLAERGGALTAGEIASALGVEIAAVRAPLRCLYAHGRIGRRMEHYQVAVGNSVSHRQRRYRWFVCPGGGLK